MVSLWCPYGFAMVLLWFAMGFLLFPMGLVWFSYGFPMVSGGFPVVCNGFAMGFLRVSRSKSPNGIYTMLFGEFPVPAPITVICMEHHQYNIVFCDLPGTGSRFTGNNGYITVIRGAITVMSPLFTAHNGDLQGFQTYHRCCSVNHCDSS